MARTSIYKSEVMRARDKLVAMGRRPSIDAVRIELGNTGSKGTIHRYLREIEEEEGGRTGTKVAVSEALQDLVTRLAERLHEEADQRMAALSQKHDEKITERDRELTALRGESDSFRKQVEQLTSALATEKAAHTATQTTLQEERTTSARQTQRLTDMGEQLAKEEAHCASLEEKHRHAHSALEHFRTAAKEQRESEQRQFEQQIQFLQGELRMANETLGAKQHELIRSHEDNARLASELTHAGAEFRRLDSETRLLRAAKEALGVVEAKNQQLDEQLRQRDAEAAQRLAAYRDGEQKLAMAVAEGQRLERELAVVNAVLASYERLLPKRADAPVVAGDDSGIAKPSQADSERAGEAHTPTNGSSQSPINDPL
jgi:chromosome segregation ATPase